MTKTTAELFRVEDKRNVNMNGRRTAFKLYRHRAGAFVFAGEFTAMGWDQPDDKCISAALDTIDRLEETDPQV